MEQDAKEYRRERRQERKDAESRGGIRTRPPSKAYRDNWDSIFGKKKEIK